MIIKELSYFKTKIIGLIKIRILLQFITRVFFKFGQNKFIQDQLMDK
jgi:hypothetical protein